MRQITIDFDKMTVQGLIDNKYVGYLGEHNATELVINKPESLEGVKFSVAFMTNGEVIHSKFFDAEETVSVALWQQLTQDNTLYVQLEAYDVSGNYLGKSNVAKLNLDCSVHGIDVVADSDNPDVYSEIALNSWFRETLEDNADTLDKLTTSVDGKLLFDGKEIEGNGSGSDLTEEQAADLAANTEARHTHSNKYILDELKTDSSSGRLMFGTHIFAGTTDLSSGMTYAEINNALNDIEVSGKKYLGASNLKYYTEKVIRDYIDPKISAVPKFSIDVVDALPETDISTSTIYFVPTSDNAIKSSLDYDEESVYNEGKGYKENAYYSWSAGEDVEREGIYLTGFIPMVAGSTVLLENVGFDFNNPDCIFYIGMDPIEHTKVPVDQLVTYWGAKLNDEGELISLAIPYNVGNKKYFRIQASYIGDDSAVYINREAGNHYTEYIYVNGEWERLGSRSVDVNLSNYYTKQETDKTFAKKSEIPTDESYELVGQTPLTLENGGNIKLVADGEATFDIYTPTVANADDITPRLSNCSLSTEKGYYEFSVTDGSASRTNIYAEYIFEGLTVGEEYNLLFNIDGLAENISEKIWHGNITVWHGDTTASGMMFVSGHYLKNGALNFTAQSDKILVRYYLAQNPAPFDGWIAHFNKMYINKANTSNKLTEIYNNTATFTDVVALKGVPSKAIVTTNPTSSVYRKAPTDKTLTQSDVPADAEVTGKEIAEVKSYLPLYGKTIVNFGDSIFGNAQPPNDISTFLAEKTGATVYNCGFGGCRMSQHVSAWDAFSMYNLANSIANNDYTMQETALESTEVDLPDRFTPSVERLKGIDFSKVDIVTIAYGTNDFTSNIDMDNEENAYDTTTLAGALRYSVEQLLTSYPNVRIFVLSTAYRAWLDDNNSFIYDSNTHTNVDGVKLADYNSKLKEVAEEYNLTFVDDYIIGINQFNRLQYFPVADGTHHNETGRKLIASHLAKELY